MVERECFSQLAFSFIIHYFSDESPVQNILLHKYRELMKQWTKTPNVNWLDLQILFNTTLNIQL